MGSVISPTAYNLATEGALNLFSKIEDLGRGAGNCSCGGSAAAINYIQNIIDLSDDPHPEIMVRGNAYADDLAYQISGKNLAKLQVKMQWVLDKLQIWAASCGLEFSSKKTNIIIFNNKHKIIMPTACKINGEKIMAIRLTV